MASKGSTGCTVINVKMQPLGRIRNFAVPASPWFSYSEHLRRRRALLLGGDTAVLFLFAAIGRKNHGEGLQLAQTFNTALPFLVGVYSCHHDGLTCCYGRRSA